ncbi:MAG: cupin domain-containing protein [Pseudomonadales bacterium]|nr:cupin domain-containing protein [Pseudomonadales bacterium]
MELTVKKKLFDGKKEAIKHAIELGLWPIAQLLEKEEKEEIHWHKWDTHIYVIAGRFVSIDPDTNNKTVLEKGDYMLMPKRKLHAMNSSKDTIVVYATENPINFSKPVNLSAEEL